MTIPGPLRPWLWCCIWIISIWSGLLLLDRSGGRQADNRGRILDAEGIPAASPAFREKSAASTRILALGDSLMLHSLPSSDEFSSMLGRETEWLHLCRGAGRWTDFESDLDALRSSNPDLIIVQDSLLKEPIRQPTRLEKAFFNLRKLIGRMMRDVLFSGSTAAEDESRFELAEVKNSLRATYATTNPVLPGALGFLARLQSTSGSVVVIHLPRSGAGREEDAWLDHLRRELKHMDIPVVTLGQPLPSDHYWEDQSHTNAKGRAVRIEQFKIFVSEHSP